MSAPITVGYGSYSSYPGGALFADFHKRLMDGMAACATRYVSTDLPMGFMREIGLGEPAREYRNFSSNHHMLLVGDAVIHLNHSAGSGVTIEVGAHHIDFAVAESERIAELIPRKPVNENIVSTSIWHMGANGPSNKLRDITAQSWVDVERNYAPDVAKSLSELMKTGAPVTEHGGRIILWYGPPGTGKTTALRALGREWQNWCELHVISDPEVLMKSPDYLFHLADTGSKWRLIVAEDSDAFLHSSSGGHASMGRLLNFSDGLLGQGSKTLFLLTTNEPVTKLHPAVTRPGRCLAQIEFSPFTATEAAAWLGEGYKAPTSSRTLAELFEDLRDDGKKITQETEYEPVGQYL